MIKELLKKGLLPLAIAAFLTLGITGCQEDSDDAASEHPTKDQVENEHPKADVDHEHPKAKADQEHPKAEGDHEHPE